MEPLNVTIIVTAGEAATILAALEVCIPATGPRSPAVHALAGKLHGQVAAQVPGFNVRQGLIDALRRIAEQGRDMGVTWDESA